MKSHYMFSFEMKRSRPTCENELTSNVFGTLDLLGEESLRAFLGHFTGRPASFPKGIELEFWKTYEGKQKDRLNQDSREPDVVFRSSEGHAGVFVECKLADEINTEQLLDELYICEDNFDYPHLLVVCNSLSSRESVDSFVRSLPDTRGGVSVTTWKSIRRFFVEHRESLKEDSDTLRELTESLISLMSHYGYRDTMGLDEDILRSIPTNVGILHRFLREIQIMAQELEEGLRGDRLAFLRQRGGEEIVRSTISSKKVPDEWIMWEITFPIVDNDWYKNGICDFKHASYLYLTFYLDHDEFYVGYWGRPGTFGDLGDRIVPARNERGPFVLISDSESEAEKKEAMDRAERLHPDFPLNFLGSEKNKDKFLDIFYKLNLTDLSKGQVRGTIDDIHTYLIGLRDFVLSSGLRA